MNAPEPDHRPYSDLPIASILSFCNMCFMKCSRQNAIYLATHKAFGWRALFVDLLAIAFFFAVSAAKADESRSIIERCKRLPSHPDRMECVFRHGMAAKRQRRYRAAIRLFRHMLAQEPDLPRVRLELAESYFLIGNDAQAEHHFRYALGNGLPRQVEQRVLAYLDAMRERKFWSASLDFSVIPQSNVNRATKKRVIVLGGIPWTLDAESRKQSGLRVNASGDFTARPYLAENLRGHVRLTPSVSATTDGKFRISRLNVEDLSFASWTLTLNGELGLVFLADLQEVSAGVALGHTWSEGESYLWTYGGWLRMQRELGPRTLGYVSLALDRLDYASTSSYEDGWEWRVSPVLRQQLNAWLAATVSASFTWHAIKPKDEAYISGGIGLGLDAILPYDFSLYTGVNLDRTRYQRADDVFGKRRKDWKVTATVRLTYGKFTAFDLAPYIQYQYERRNSSISFYDYDNHSVNIGLTKQF